MKLKILLLFSSFLLFFSFVFFSYLTGKEKFTQMDFDLTVKFQDHLSRRLDAPFSMLSLIGSVEMTGLIWVLLLIFTLIKRYWLTAVTLFTFWVAIAIEVFGKIFVYHPGPPFLFYRGIFDFQFPSSYAHTNFSYPSGHMTRTSFLVAFLIIFLYFKAPFKVNIFVQIALLAFAVLMFVSRIYLGEHWTTDVIGGALLGGSAGILTAVTVPIKEKISSLKESLNTHLTKESVLS